MTGQSIPSWEEIESSKSYQNAHPDHRNLARQQWLNDGGLEIEIKQRLAAPLPVEEPAVQPYAPERGIVGDIGSRLARGAVSTVELAGHALGTMGADKIGRKLVQTSEGLLKDVDFLKQDESEVKGEGFIKRGVMGGVESAVPSLSGGLGGAALGAGVGSVIPGVGTLAGGLIGGAAGALGLFGAGVYGKEKEAALKAGLSEEQAHKHGLEQGVIEGGIEFIATPIELLTGGFGKVATQPLKSTIKDLLKTPLKTMVKNYGKTMGVETSTEMLQSGLGNEFAKKHGMADGATTEAVLESIIPAITMSLMFGMGSQALTSVHKGQVKKALTDETVDENTRNAAVEEVYAQILPEDVELANVWKEMSTERITRGESINIDEDFTNYAVRKKTLEQGSDEGGSDDVVPGASVTSEGITENATSLPEEPKGVLSRVAEKVPRQVEEILPAAPVQAAAVAEQTPVQNDLLQGVANRASIENEPGTMAETGAPTENFTPVTAANSLQDIEDEYGFTVARQVEKARAAKEDISIDEAINRANTAIKESDEYKAAVLQERRTLRLTPREAMTLAKMRHDGVSVTADTDQLKKVYGSLQEKGIAAFDESNGGYTAVPVGELVTKGEDLTFKENGNDTMQQAGNTVDVQGEKGRVNEASRPGEESSSHIGAKAERDGQSQVNSIPETPGEAAQMVASHTTEQPGKENVEHQALLSIRNPKHTTLPTEAQRPAFKELVKNGFATTDGYTYSITKKGQGRLKELTPPVAGTKNKKTLSKNRAAATNLPEISDNETEGSGSPVDLNDGAKKTIKTEPVNDRPERTETATGADAVLPSMSDEAPQFSAKTEERADRPTEQKNNEEDEPTLVIKYLQTGKEEHIPIKDLKGKLPRKSTGKTPDKNLTPSAGKAIVEKITGGKQNGELRTDSPDVPRESEPTGTSKAGKGKDTGRVSTGRGGAVRGSGADNNQPDVKQPAGRNNGQNAKSEAGSEGSKGTDTSRPDGIPYQPVNYRITEADKLGSGGSSTKARDNIKAIKVLKAIQKENRPATAEEQALLVKYVGWGASELANSIFPQKKWSHETRSYEENFKKGWASMGAELQKLLSKEEYAAAKRSTLNAHYTSENVIKGMYKALERFGYRGNGRALEPGSGIGNFLGLIPDSLSGTRFTTVEMDPVSAGIAKALYPTHDVHTMDYAKFKAPDNFFDIAIGNPPFDQTTIETDPDYAQHKFALHDFFFAKTIDKVRPGGFMVLVTSRYTMDKANDKARAYLSKRADLLGAIRLPQTAFKKNAGTEVVTDVLFLQKREAGTKGEGAAWSTLKEIQAQDKNQKGHSFYVNEYFADHPEMVLGHNSAEGSMHQGNEYTVKPLPGNIADHFSTAVGKLPKDIYQQAEPTLSELEVAEIEFSPSSIKEGGFHLDRSGNILQKENGVGQKVAATGKKQQIITDFVALRDAVRQVLYVQMKGEGDKSLKDAQTRMATAYDRFVGSHGAINKATRVVRKLADDTESISYRYPNFQYFKSDPDSYLVAAIEKYDLDSGKTSKADIFTKRVIAPEVEPKIESLTDALNVTLYQVGKVDMGRVAKLMQVSEQEAIDGLGTAVYFDPDGRRWVTDDEYLSGDVRLKLKNALAAAVIDDKFQRNVKALEAAQPEDLPPSRITISLGMPILEPDHIKQFAGEVIGMGVRVGYLPQDGSWSITTVSGEHSAGATSDFGTARRNAAQLLGDALNGRAVKIYDRDSDGNAVFNKVATETATAKLQKIKDRFKAWVWEDAGRTEVLAKKFNELYNTTVPRNYGGDHIKVMTFPGMSRTIVPFDHQKRVAWRVVQKGNTYMAHSVGAGKTIASIIAGMEQKRLGIKKKPMWTVPNHMLKQFAGEFLELYPGAKLLVADEAQFSKENRNRFMGRVAAENWDGIILTHSAFGKIPMLPEFQAQFIEEHLEEIEMIMLETEGDYAKTKQIERHKKRLEQRLEKILASQAKDKGVTFEETGIDQIFVDEAHEFRKLDFVTNQSGISGIDPSGSQMAFDLYTKTRYLETLSPGRSTVLMSGTPITNTMGEVFTLQRYLQEDKLRQLGLHHFDSWAATFGNMVTTLESTPAGSYKPVTRFGEFNNMPSLAGMWAEIGDAVHARDLHYLTRPKVKGGGRRLIVGETSEVQQNYKKLLGKRIELIQKRKGPPKKGDDIILSVITDGRHAALDDRFINRNAPARPDSKIELMLEKVFGVWDRSKEQRSTQMIFSDLGLPGTVEKRGFSVYTYIKEELVKRGVPENEIAFMQDYKKSDQKIKLFKDMNEGKVRVLIGSSQAMGTGVNAQRKLIALHHFDPDSYLPANIEQREGRIVRQGNEKG